MSPVVHKCGWIKWRPVFLKVTKKKSLNWTRAETKLYIVVAVTFNTRTRLPYVVEYSRRAQQRYWLKIFGHFYDVNYQNHILNSNGRNVIQLLPKKICRALHVHSTSSKWVLSFAVLTWNKIVHTTWKYGKQTKNFLLIIYAILRGC